MKQYLVCALIAVAFTLNAEAAPKDKNDNGKPPVVVVPKDKDKYGSPVYSFIRFQIPAAPPCF
jgi:hypothetical protein